MIQLAALLGISWLLIWFFEKKNLSVLGLVPTKYRIKYTTILFIVSAACSLTAFLLRMYFAKETYTVTPGLTISSIAIQVWNQFRTVLTEELFCRGVLLYILIRKTCQQKAILISAVLFALLHWLNGNVWGNMTQMMMVFAVTFPMGILLAYSYAKTFSLLIPFAIHFGWNLTQNYIFPDTANGDHFFILAGPPPLVTVSYFVFYMMFLLPKIALLVLNYLIVKQYKCVEAL